MTCDFCGNVVVHADCEKNGEFLVYAKHARDFRYPGFYCCNPCRAILDAETTSRTVREQMIENAGFRVAITDRSHT